MKRLLVASISLASLTFSFTAWAAMQGEWTAKSTIVDYIMYPEGARVKGSWFDGASDSLKFCNNDGGYLKPSPELTDPQIDRLARVLHTAYLAKRSVALKVDTLGEADCGYYAVNID